ncbi:MAG: peptide deformylase [Melioribacteraceae bacterium]|nr:peptide deformylase [Melioribacteraceae bacterium]
MNRILQIAQLGNPILYQLAKEINDIEIESDFISDMKITVTDANGVGLAAPQVYEPKRIFIIASKPNIRYPNAPEMKPTAIINPEIIWTSEEIVNDWEGCLSIPGLRGFVPRFKSIKAEYYDENGERQQSIFDDFIARIFQHEYDHLNGILFLDRIENTKDLLSEKEFQKQILSK